MGRTTDNRLTLMTERASFIKQNILSSDKEEFDEKDLVVIDLCKLINDLDDYDRPGISLDINDNHSRYGGHMRVQRLPRKLFRCNIYKKSDLIYRLDEILTLIDSYLGNKKENKRCISCKSVIVDDAKFCANCGTKL